MRRHKHRHHEAGRPLEHLRDGKNGAVAHDPGDQAHLGGGLGAHVGTAAHATQRGPSGAGSARRPQRQTQPSCRAGLPRTSACGATSRVTTAPAATNAKAPMVMPGTMHGAAAERGAAMHARRRKPGRRLLVAPAGERRARGPRDAVVREHNPGTHEDVVVQGHSVPDRDGVLHGHAVADDGAGLDVAVPADVAVGTDRGPGQDVREGPDPRPVPQVLRLDEGRWVDHVRPVATGSASASTAAPTGAPTRSA